jgi:hypothetical protein
MAMMGHRVPERAVSSVWILYPFTPAPGEQWIPAVWFVLGAFGAAVQFGVTGRKKF